MWRMDPELWKELSSIRELVALRHQNPTKEWPLVFVDEFDVLLVVANGRAAILRLTRRPITRRKSAKACLKTAGDPTTGPLSIKITAVDR